MTPVVTGRAAAAVTPGDVGVTAAGRRHAIDPVPANTVAVGCTDARADQWTSTLSINFLDICMSIKFFTNVD
jgi:hypothetical protein